jgi:hypothetical protein
MEKNRKLNKKTLNDVNNAMMQLLESLRRKGPNSMVSIAELSFIPSSSLECLIDKVRTSSELYFDENKRIIKKRK